MINLGIYLERKPDSGGAYQYCLAMLKALKDLPEDKYNVTAFVMYHEWEQVTGKLGLKSVYAQKNKFQKVVYYAVEKTLPVSVCRKIAKHIHPFGKALRRNNIDYCIYPCADKISFMMDTKAVITVFDLMHRYLTKFPEISDAKIYKTRERSYSNIAKYAKLILVDSKVGKEQMEECYGEFLPKEDIIRSLPFIAPDYVYCASGVGNKASVSTFDRYIFYPAQFWLHKNHRNLLLAMKKLKDEGIIVNLVCSGTSKNGLQDTKELISALSLEKQVEILGYVSNDEVVSLYKNAVALVMPTFGGPTNIPQLEAFELGCPVATSRIFGIPDQVGDAALLFDPDSIDEIADCIRKLWLDNNVCEMLIEKGKLHSANYGQKEFSDLLLGYLNELCKEQS